MDASFVGRQQTDRNWIVILNTHLEEKVAAHAKKMLLAKVGEGSPERASIGEVWPGMAIPGTGHGWRGLTRGLARAGQAWRGLARPTEGVPIFTKAGQG